MKKINIVVMLNGKQLKPMDVIMETLLLVDPHGSINVKAVKFNNIINVGEVELYGEDFQFVIFAEGDKFELNDIEKNNVKKVVEKKLEEPGDGVYSDVMEDGYHYDIMWSNSVSAEENGLSF